MTRFIFITGGVVSSLGKGLTASALAALLQGQGYSVRLRKLDPYLNIDPGTMNPFEHGEVYVTDDGAETDLDLGHYERFTDIGATRSDCMTTGQVYDQILRRERRGDYLGATVQVIPHVTDAIQERIRHGLNGEDFCICEIGGTVGDIEGLPFLEAVRQFAARENVAGAPAPLFIHVTLAPPDPGGSELKTKPTQHSVRELQAAGIRPGMLVVRCDRALGTDARRKLALFCNVDDSDIMVAENTDVLYALPLILSNQAMEQRVLQHFNLKPKNGAESLSRWRDITEAVRSPSERVRIGVIGKYTGLRDAYLSLNEALVHGGIANLARVETDWLAADELLQGEEGLGEKLSAYDGLLVPGGFGERGAEGKIRAIQYARERGVPFLGICLGMQLALVETARNQWGEAEAGSSEFGACAPRVVGLLTEWQRDDGGTEHRSNADDKGGTMRLGAYKAQLAQNSLAQRIYEADTISERHRHRYEVDISYEDKFKQAGLVFSGKSPDGTLPEIVEHTDHPWFIGVQFHPELKSRPFSPHPLFASFIRAARDQSRLV